MATQHEQALAERFLNKRVKRSWRTLRNLWRNWQAFKKQPKGAGLKLDFDDQASHRGTVVEIIVEDVNHGIAWGLKVKWDHGLENKCLPHEIDIVK